ncbi:NUDIX domain-containing protein [Nocardia cyriacigeorgica]|uniref:NUDIX hydrolase n=2 Tax=Nocardia cyriacigeorgica TaxID=135487 RepID=UPI001895A0CA|nr:NUDIX domain-containing protein [Nocardia cyriacigeorgica]MBF6424155.1 NUDIX domain-containing protein [Nocardia cyriacigeorgica]
MHHPRIRVAAYVIRYRTTPELLVFDHAAHPEAGTQIPAGGVHSGESLEQAVLREVAEETGLRAVSLVEQLAVDNRPHPLTHYPRRTTFFHLHARTDTPDTWTHRVDGEGADHGLIFTCRFVQLPLETPLADQQDRWLSRISS